MFCNYIQNADTNKSCHLLINNPSKFTRERERERENFCNYIQNADTNEICYFLMNISSNFTGKRVSNDEYGHK